MRTRAAILLGVTCLALSGCASRTPAVDGGASPTSDVSTAAEPGARPAVFARIAGTWDWPERPGSCRENPHTISFTPDGRYMLLTFAQPIDSATGNREVRYTLKGHTERSVRGAIVDETRRTPSGELVEWDLVLFSATSYRWHRTDWPETSFTPEVVRCSTAL